MEFILSHDTDVHVHVILGWLPFSLILACMQTAILILHLIVIKFVFTLQHSPYVDLGVVMFPFTFPMLENVTKHLDISWEQ